MYNSWLVLGGALTKSGGCRREKAENIVFIKGRFLMKIASCLLCLQGIPKECPFFRKRLRWQVQTFATAVSHVSYQGYKRYPENRLFSALKK